VKSGTGYDPEHIRTRAYKTAPEREWVKRCAELDADHRKRSAVRARLELLLRQQRR
jgi:hypothetical protein